jgi:hypothetical protein
MISKKQHRYGGKRLAVGDKFLVPGQTAVRLLKGLGRAEVAPPEPPPETYRPRPARTTLRRSQVAQPAGEADVSEAIEPPAGQTYMRRDLTAE